MKNFQFVFLRDGKKINDTTFDSLKFSKQLTAWTLSENIRESLKKVGSFISVKLLSVFLLGVLILNNGCKKNDDIPPIENEEEIITDIILTFTPAGGGTDIIATAQDPDGEGVQDLQITKNIELLPNTTYTMSIKLENNIDMVDITKEVEDEGDEHLFFFEFTADSFSDPSGNGNTDHRADPVNYNDTDQNGLPIGLSSTWTTGDATNGASFRIVLKHQPDVKSTSSSITDGGTDVDLTWPLTIQ